jgi:NADPH-dependent curcumin reductase
MIASINHQIVLVNRPVGTPKETDFRLVEAPIRMPGEGEVLVKNLFLSLDPYMRGRMREERSYAKPVPLGEVMVGGTVAEVVASNNAAFPVGTFVLGMLGWQEYAFSDGAGLRRVEGGRVPLSAYLGAVGMPGVTAYVGLFDIGAPKAGETVVVGAAAGAVGSVVGQLAKLSGCRAVGVAGGQEKCDFVVKELGFDACVDHRSADLAEALAAATPKGIDVYFENVGGALLDLVLPRLNTFARIPLCGLVSQYNATEPHGVTNFAWLLVNRVKLQGFIVADHMNRFPEAIGKLSGWVVEGKIKMKETIAEGIESAPRAFIGMLRGENLGKQLVRLG